MCERDRLCARRRGVALCAGQRGAGPLPLPVDGRGSVELDIAGRGSGGADLVAPLASGVRDDVGRDAALRCVELDLHRLRDRGEGEGSGGE